MRNELTKKEKFNPEIFYRAVNGDEESVERTIEAFTPMIHMWINKYGYRCPESSKEDLVQEGVMGIIKAIRTFDSKRSHGEDRIKPSTWIWWKTRDSVQRAAYRIMRQTHFNLPLIDIGQDVEEDWFNVESMPVSIETLLEEGCGSLTCRNALIVRDKFGLFNTTPMKNGELAKKYGISKQNACLKISAFMKTIKEKYPELKKIIS